MFTTLQCCLMAFTVSRAVSSALYSIDSFYLDWWGATGFSALAFLSWLYFSYTFPVPRYPRERRVVLTLAVTFTLVLFVWMGWVTFANPAHLLNPLTSEGLPVGGNLATYVPDEFLYRFVEVDDFGWTTHNMYSAWVILLNIWVFGLWLRKALRDFQPVRNGLDWRAVFQTLYRPPSREALISRDWALLTLVVLLPSAASFLEPAAALPAGSFTVCYLIVLFVIFVGYLHYAPEETSFLVRLVGSSLLTTLLIMGLVSSAALRDRQEMYHQIQLAQLNYIQLAITDGNTSIAPAGDIMYVAARQPDGLFSDHYDMLFSRSQIFTAAALAAWDGRLRQGLEQGDLRFQVAAVREMPWLGFNGVAELMKDPARISSVALPESTMMFRGVSFQPAAQVIRYSFMLNGKRYEVGFNYLDYRQELKNTALPWAASMLIAAFLMIVIFTIFFRIIVVNPLVLLSESITRVDKGDLSVYVPVNGQDEIGKLSGAFNRMVVSLSVSKENLESMSRTLKRQVAERTRDLTSIYEITVLVNQSHVTDELLWVSLQQIAASIRADAGMILLPNLSGDQFYLPASYKLPDNLVKLLPAARLWNSFQEQPQTRVFHNLSTNSLQTEFFPSVQNFPFTSLVGIPIHLGQEKVGFLVLFGLQPDFFKSEDIELLEAVARQLSLAIENIHLRERIAASAVLDERQRLARDLHDSVTQLLYSQVLFADAATKAMRSGQSEKIQHYLSRLSESARNALREMRLLLYRLIPFALSQLGLAGALQRRLELVEQRAGMETHFVYNLSIPLSTDTEEGLYFIAEEALNNVVKHAGANTVWLRIHLVDGYIEMKIKDDGIGFTNDGVSSGLGLGNMQERATSLGGNLAIESVKSGGTQLRVRLPYSIQNIFKADLEEISHAK